MLNLVYQAVNHFNNFFIKTWKTKSLPNPTTGQYQLGMFLKLNTRGGEFKYAVNQSYEENYLLVHE